MVKFKHVGDAWRAWEKHNFNQVWLHQVSQLWVEWGKYPQHIRNQELSVFGALGGVCV